MFYSKQIRGLITPSLFLFLSILVLLSIQNVSATPPFQTSTGGTGMQIEYTKYDFIYVGDAHRFHAHVINDTAVKTNKTTACLLHLYNQTGWDTYANASMEFEAYNNVDFAATVPGTYFATPGEYSYVIQCNSSNEIAFISAPITVIPKVISTPSAKSDWRIFVILTLLAMALLVFSLYSENYIFSFFTGIVFVLSGMYSLIYGFDNVTDLYTRAIGVILLGIGGILAALSVYNLMRENYGGDKDEEED